MKARSFLFACALAASSGIYAHPGIGIVENSKGEIFFTDLKQVWKISTQGDLTVAVPAVHTHELFLDADGNLYGEHLWYTGDARNTWAHYVWKLSSRGALTKVIPDREGFLENYSFVRDHFGRMYWADRSSECQKVARRNADNTITHLGNQCFHNIRKMEVLPDGAVVLVDFQDLKKVDTRGQVKTVATRIANKKWTTANADNQNSVMGIWADKKGNLYAAVSSARVIKRFGLSGQEEIAFRSTIPWAPSGGMVDSRERLWVLEYDPLNAVRVICVLPNGEKTTFTP